MDSPYSDILLKHYKIPVHAGDLSTMPYVVEVRNRACGDMVRLGVEFQSVSGEVEDKLRPSEPQEALNSAEKTNLDPNPDDMAWGVQDRTNRATIKDGNFDSGIIRGFESLGLHHTVKAEHSAQGCMLCKASASVLCQVVDGRTVVEAREILSYARSILDINFPEEKLEEPKFMSGSDQMGDIKALFEARKFPSRKKCFLLAWDALDQLTKQISS